MNSEQHTSVPRHTGEPARARASDRSTNITRRTMLTAVASALPTTAIAASSIADPHPDAELIQFGVLFDTMSARADALEMRADLLREELYKRVGRPELLKISEDDHEDFGAYLQLLRPGHFFNESHGEQLRAWLHRALRHNGSSIARGIARAQTIIPALESWASEESAANKQLGVDQADQEFLDTHDQVSDLIERIVAVPAATLDGIAVKARVAGWCSGDLTPRREDGINVMAMMSMTSDLMALRSGTT